MMGHPENLGIVPGRLQGWARRILHGLLICSILMLGSAGHAGSSSLDYAPADETLVVASSSEILTAGSERLPIDPAPSAALQRWRWECSRFDGTRQARPRIAARLESWLRELRSVVLLR